MKKDKKQDLWALSIIAICAILMFIGMFRKCNTVDMHRHPRGITYKDLIKETNDSIWLKVTKYSVDTTYEEVLPNPRPKHRFP